MLFVIVWCQQLAIAMPKSKIETLVPEYVDWYDGFWIAELGVTPHMLLQVPGSFVDTKRRAL